MAWRKEILLQRWNHLTNKYIFWGTREILFFGKDTKIGETLDEVYRVKWWLYWKITLLFIKKPLFTLKSHALVDPPSYSHDIEFKSTKFARGLMDFVTSTETANIPKANACLFLHCKGTVLIVFSKSFSKPCAGFNYNRLS